MTKAYFCSFPFLLKHNKMFSSHGGPLDFAMYDHRETIQLELPREIPRNSVESDRGCTSRIYFDNAGDNVTLTSQKPCQHNNKCDCSKTNGLNEVNVFQKKIAIFH